MARTPSPRRDDRALESIVSEETPPAAALVGEVFLREPRITTWNSCCEHAIRLLAERPRSLLMKCG